MSLTPGIRLGSYEVLSLLGTGGMGEVYAARDCKLGRIVALKVLPSDLAHDPARLARLEREARAVAALNHPSIVTLFALERHDDQPFLVMERVEGRPLAALIGPGGLDFDKILRIALPVAQALSAAHRQGIVHRDLKPGNIMLTTDGRVKVLDFGLAQIAPVVGDETTRVSGSLTRTAEGQVIGTLGYMSPEQLRGERADERSDVFSFGATLYEMATGRRPFGGTGSADVLSAVLRDEPVSLDRIRPDLPPRLVRLVTRCLAKDPLNRVQSALDLCHELEDLQAEQLRARRPRVRWSRPRRIVALAAAALVLVLAAVFLTSRLAAPVAPAPSTSIRSIAVLPFDNLMRDSSQDYFVDGLHDALITELARTEGVRVTSRSSVMRYRAKPPESLKAVARELAVDALVEGSVLRSGNRVRVSAQLIAGSSDEHIWAQSYDRDMQDVLSLLDDVSHAIATEIGARISRARPSFPGSPQVRPEAYEAWLQGRSVLHNLTSIQDYWRARDWFARAVAIDPAFARARSSLGGVDHALVFFGLAPPQHLLPEAREAAGTALKLDPRDGAAYGVLGSIALYNDWNFSDAKGLLEKAVALDPHSFSTRHAYADYLMVTGQVKSSAEQTRIASANEADSAMAHVVAATHAAAARDFDDAIARARSALARFPSLPGVQLHVVMADAFWAQGRERDALAEYGAAFGTESAQILEREATRAGSRAALRALARHLEVTLRNQPAETMAVAGLYAEGNDADAAFRLVERAYAARTPQLLHVVALPSFDSIRRDPRYARLLERVGLHGAPR